MTERNGAKRIERVARLQWVPLAQMKIAPLAQRELRQSWVDAIVAEFDPERLGNPTVNRRDEAFYVVDGQHRVEALRQMHWGDQAIQCWTYEGLTESEEAEKFLQLQSTLGVRAFDKFRVGVQAGREVETDINRIVMAQQLVVSNDAVPGAIRAVGTLTKLYKRSDGPTLGRTLRLIRDSFGDSGLEAPVIDGLGLLCQRYNGQLDDKIAIQKLANVHGGVSGLLGKAENIRRQTGNQKSHCVAAAAVEIIRIGSNGKRLPSWWKTPA